MEYVGYTDNSHEASEERNNIRDRLFNMRKEIGILDNEIEYNYKRIRELRKRQSYLMYRYSRCLAYEDEIDYISDECTKLSDLIHVMTVQRNKLDYDYMTFKRFGIPQCYKEILGIRI